MEEQILLRHVLNIDLLVDKIVRVVVFQLAGAVENIHDLQILKSLFASCCRVAANPEAGPDLIEFICFRNDDFSLLRIELRIHLRNKIMLSIFNVSTSSSPR